MKWLLVIPLLSVFASADGSITGAKVDKIVFANGSATITIRNTSQHDITNYSIAIVASGDRSTRTRDYGAGQGLHPGEATEEASDFPSNVRSVTATVTVAIYDDQTAEVTDEHMFANSIEQRREIAQAWQESAEVLDRAVSDPEPLVRAVKDLTTLASAAASSQRSTESRFVTDTVNVLKSAPAVDEADFLKEQAARLHRQGAIAASYAKVNKIEILTSKL